jgi:non-ribosomal peptide synthetase component E (peptide arylation enzyme)
MNQTFQQFIKQQSGKSPSATALLAPGRPSLEYRALYQQLESIAARLNLCGERAA